MEAVAKRIDSRESDDIDKETIVNAVSTQLSVNFGDTKKLLLTGDSSFEALKDNLKDHSAIQLPHHGKLVQAEEIFDAKDNYTVYFVSDNTGDTNGGSDKLVEKYKRGHVIYTPEMATRPANALFRVTTSVGSYSVGGTNALPSHKSQAHELKARQEYLFDIFHLYSFRENRRKHIL
ncbi:MAG: hypothetical protein ACLSB9_22565 [Hydrogeniiclostridium mannosilyticum]